MDTVLFSGEIFRDEAAMEARVVTFAVRTYGDQIAPELLERWAREAVAEVWGKGPTVTKYVPMLALRQVREHVNEYTRKHVAARRAGDKAGYRTSVARSQQSQFDHVARDDSRPARPAALASHSLVRDVTKPQHQRGHDHAG